MQKPALEKMFLSFKRQKFNTSIKTDTKITTNTNLNQSNLLRRPVCLIFHWQQLHQIHQNKLLKFYKVQLLTMGFLYSLGLMHRTKKG